MLDSVKDFGVFWLLRLSAEKIGLLKILKNCFPANWLEIFTLACYLVADNRASMYCDTWLDENEWLDVGNMSSQRISELLGNLGVADKIAFYRQWCEHLSSEECLALDITSISSYSKQMSECEWGHNRDNEKLPQINLCLLFGETSRLPVYQTSFSGSIGDVSTLETTMNEFTSMVGDVEFSFVTDKGFYSKKNVNTLLHRNIRFLVSVPFTNGYAIKLVETYGNDIDKLENVITTNDVTKPIRGTRKTLAWGNDGTRLNVHLFFDPYKALKERNELYGKIALIRKIAETNPFNKKYATDIKHYFKVRKSSKDRVGYSVKVRENVVNASLKNSGWLVMLSNHIEEPQEAIEIYRLKDVVEKGFMKYKNNLGLDRLRVHGDTRAQNKTFVAFISLILSSYIHNVMKDKDLYKTLTFEMLLSKLANLKSATVNGERFLRTITKQQKDIFKAFDIPVPNSSSVV
jgi:transposase